MLTGKLFKGWLISVIILSQLKIAVRATYAMKALFLFYESFTQNFVYFFFLSSLKQNNPTVHFVASFTKERN